MTCTKCGTKLITGGDWEKQPSQHHVYPVRWFGKGKNNRLKVLLCGHCHRELEYIIKNLEERLIAINMKQQGLSHRLSKRHIRRMFRSRKSMYLQLVNDYIGR